MNCSDFQTNLDLYLDAELDDVKMPAAASHVARCRSCEHIVTDHQQARALLITAVADKAAAVDVSGLWGEISRRLDEPSNVSFLAAFRARRALRMPSPLARRISGVHVGAFAATAAAAALVASLFTVDRPTTPEQTARRPPAATSVSSGAGVIAQSRPVRIDSMEIAAGHTVSTWIKPRTKTRVIWVASSDSGGFGVSNVNETR